LLAWQSLSFALSRDAHRSRHVQCTRRDRTPDEDVHGVQIPDSTHGDQTPGGDIRGAQIPDGTHHDKKGHCTTRASRCCLLPSCSGQSEKNQQRRRPRGAGGLAVLCASSALRRPPWGIAFTSREAGEGVRATIAVRREPSPVRSPPYWSGLPPPTSREGRCSGLSAILLRREEFGARAKRGFLSYDGRLCEAPYSHRLILVPPHR
jgi:hypothetical protein